MNLAIKSPVDIDIHTSSFIEASAGTGKTYNLVRLFLRYVLEKQIPYEKILMVTFTKKATGEMTERFINLVREGFEKKSYDFLTTGKYLNPIMIEKLEEILRNIDKLNIFTIHSFCNSLLKKYSFYLNIPLNTKLIYSEDEYLQEILYQILIGKETRKVLFENIEVDYNLLLTYIKRFIESGKRLKDYTLNFLNSSFKFSEIIDDEKLKNIIIHQTDKRVIIYLKIFNYVYKELHKKKQMDGVITYDDMIYMVYKSILEKPDFLENLQNEYCVGIIDEFQDTDYIQWEIFSKIFLKEGNSLVVVGDPKQAIYGFRGADIYTYFDARKMLLERNAKSYVLDVNYRSDKNLLKDINEWFRIIFGKSHIPKIEKYLGSYKDLLPNPGAPEHIDSRIYYLEICRDSGDSIDKLREKYAKSVASCIKFLKEEVNYSDIAILYRNSTELKYIKYEFQKQNIPYIHYTDENVFNTEEALAMELLLSFLAFQNDLYIRNQFIFYFFLDVPYTDFDAYEKKYTEIQEMISSWVPLIKENQWFKIFYKILEDTKFYYKYLAFDNYEEKISNFEHLMEIVLSIASHRKISPVELYQKYKKLKNRTVFEQDEENIYKIRLSSSENKVQMMTIHKSKGLEFPVVFLLGFLNENQEKVGDSDNYKYFDEKESLWNVCFFQYNKDIESEEIKQKIRQEVFFEEFRVFYVGITRGKSKVFVPYLKEDVTNQKSSYMEEFIRKPVRSHKFLEFFKFAGNQKTNIEQKEDYTGQTLQNHFEIISNIYKNLKKIEQINYMDKVYKMESYSSLTKYIKEEEILIKDIDLHNEEYEEENSDLDEFLKPGASTGNFVHELYEKVEFMDFKNYSNEIVKQKYRNIINYLNQFHRVYHYKDEEDKESFIDFMIRFLKDSICNPIKFHQLHFSLSDIEPGKNRKELNFLIQDIQENEILKPIYGDLFFVGAMDLFFEYREHFFILDYKSTKLMNYNETTLRDYTEKHYKLQYLIYSYAIHLWLNKIKKIDLTKKLPGGIIYYYIRGYNKPSKGIDIFEFPFFEEIKKGIKDYAGR